MTFMVCDPIMGKVCSELITETPKLVLITGTEIQMRNPRTIRRE